MVGMYSTFVLFAYDILFTQGQTFQNRLSFSAHACFIVFTLGVARTF